MRTLIKQFAVNGYVEAPRSNAEATLREYDELTDILSQMGIRHAHHGKLEIDLAKFLAFSDKVRARYDH